MANLNDHDILFLNSQEFAPLVEIIEKSYKLKILSFDFPQYVSFTSRKAILNTNSGAYFLKEKPVYCSDEESLSLAAEFQNFLSWSVGFVPPILMTVNNEWYIEWQGRFYFLTEFRPGRVYSGSDFDVNNMLGSLKDFQDAAVNFDPKKIKRVKSYETLKFMSLIEERFKDTEGEGNIGSINKLIAKLKKEYNAIPQTEHIISHGDFSLFNILFDHSGVVGINDFDNVNYFPRIHDMAELLVTASIIHYLGPISNLRNPVFLKPKISVLEQIIDYYSRHFSLTDNEVKLFGVVSDIIWLELLLLAVLKDDYSLDDIMPAIHYLQSGTLRSKINEGLRQTEKLIFIWDFHGTLETGTLSVITEIANILLKENGSNRQYHTDEIAAMPSFSWRTFFKAHFPKLPPEKIEKISSDAYDEIRFEYLLKKYSKARHNAREMLQFIKDNGGVNFIVSNSKQDKLGNYINHVGLDRVIDGYYGIDDGKISSKQDVLRRKTLKIREVLNRYPKHVSFAIGDSEKDFYSARSADIHKYYWILSEEVNENLIERYKNMSSEKLNFINDLSEIIQDLWISKMKN